MKTYFFKRWRQEDKPSLGRKYPKVVPKYGYEIDPETGEKVVVQQGTTNVYAQIQEALPETLIYNIIDRINKTGDMSMLGQSVEGFIDVTSAPKSLLEAQSLRLKAEQFFDSLPIEEKQKFNNSSAQFIKAVNQGYGNVVPNVEKIRSEITASDKEVPNNG